MLICWKMIEKIKPTAFTFHLPCDPGESQGHWKWYKMVKVNGAWKQVMDEQFWSSSLYTMSNAKVSPTQNIQMDRELMARYTQTQHYMSHVTHMDQLKSQKCPATEHLHYTTPVRLYTNLQCVLEDFGGSDGHPQAFNGTHEGLHHMGRTLKYIRPHIVEQMNKSILTTKACHSQCHVLNGCHSCLSVYKVSANTHMNNKIATWHEPFNSHHLRQMQHISGWTHYN